MKDRLQDPNSGMFGLSGDSTNLDSYFPGISGNIMNTSSHSSLLERITNLSPNLVTVYNIQTGKYVFINEALKPLLGYEPSEWIHKGLDYVSSKVHPEDLPRIAKENQKAIEEDGKFRRRTDNNPIVEFEYRIKNVKGQYRWLRTYGTVFDRDKTGKVKHVINISLDITSIKAAEEKLLLLTNRLEQKVEERSKELNETARKFQVLIENSTDAIVLISKSGKLKYASPGVEKVLGYTPNEFLNIKNHGDLIHKDDRKNVVKLFTIHFKKPEDKLKTRFRVKNKYGDYCWIEVIATNLLREKSISSIVLNFRDITTQIANEKRQQEEIKNAALRIDINEALSGSNDIDLTLDMCVEAVVSKLDACLAKIWIHDKKTKALKLFSISGLKEILSEKIHKPHWVKLRNGIIASERKPYLTNDALNDREVKDKAWIRKHKIKSFAGFPLVLEGGLIGLFTFFSRNEIPPHTYDALQSVANSITQGMGRLWAKEKLVESEQKYRTIFSTLTEGIVLQDLEGKILEANSSAEEILKANFDELKKQSTDQQARTTYINEDGSDFDSNSFPFLLASKTGEPQKNHVMGIIKDNQTSWVSTNSIPLIDDEGSIYAVASSFRDITEQKRLEKQKDEFISIASHELKTPLTTIKSFNEILKMQFGEEEKAQYYLNKMHGEIDRLTGLVNELLDVSKIQSGGLTLNKEKVDLGEFVKEIVEDIQTATPTHKIIYKQSLPAYAVKNHTSAKILIDRHRIYQVLINLLSNAIKYSPKATKVIISTTVKPDKVIFSVKDFGIGITKRDKQKIFDAFFQASTTIRQSHSGLGLGLHIAEEIVKRHGGTISVVSKKGSGSIFRFHLPQANEDQTLM